MRPLALPLALLPALVACGEEGSSSTPAAAPDDSAVIARVTSSLRPSFVLKGEEPVTWPIAERMAKHKVPGVSIAVVDGGRIVWAKAFGVKEAGTSDSVTPNTLFQAASISKPVAATGMLRLVDEGKLALDTPVNDYLKSWKLPDNAFTATEKVTLRRIASHNAGLTVHGFPGYAANEAVPTVPQLLEGAKPANTKAVRVDTTPGSIWRYSGGGTTIEQLVMEDVTGEAFAPLMKRLVLDPAGMTNSGYDQPLDSARRGQEAVAHKGDGTPIAGKWHTYPERAAAGLWTTPTDLLKWAMEISAARAGKSTKVLSQKAATEMLTVQKEPSGIGPMLHNVGKPSFYFEHGGSNEGYRAQVMYFPETGQGAAVMTNGDNGGALASEILYAIAAEYKWQDYAPREITPVAVDTAAMREYVGSYQLTEPLKLNVTVTLEGGRLFLDEPQLLSKRDFVFTGKDSIFALDGGLEAAFKRDDSGKVDGLQVGPMRLKRTR